ncbi:mevalonate kinase [Promethearchaeum syntrophicum]|uniref:Mevalonate kinase n=1 Tax=Promethearchaeum syntrophicum TaxID=2594042 RepID=A0A5B9D9W1_9ARCH|nr:mevalonate kinase [Candidatus Prometheoarchaeum syntrophicum]QEE15386.1 Mevalonate kinase [Candidatus Prometheoarchaeum syntrophicum]
MRPSIASAPGKCILFGEHAVVYGYPALAIAIDVSSSCQISESDQNGISLILKNYEQTFSFLNMKDLFNKIPSKFSQIAIGLKLFSKKYKILMEKIEIEIQSDLWPESGLGSSASSSISLLGALNEFYNLELNSRNLSTLSYEMEKEVHGKPSGIDNTACSQGGLIFFKNQNFQRFNFLKQFQILITYTGKTHNTKEAIKNVKEFCDKEPKISTELFNNIGKITEKGLKELKNGNLVEFGHLMNLNHQILMEIGLSTTDIEEITRISISNNAYGSKLTGAGKGGCVISIGKLKDLKNIKEKLKKLGYSSIITSINNQGVKYGK